MRARSLFVTGVGGFIGCRLAAIAAERGWRVSGIDVSPVAVDRARQAGATAEVASVADEARLAALLAGVDVVVHTAAIVREFGKLEDFRRVNVGGTESVARAARAAGAGVFVHLSSVMVYGFSYPDGVREDGPLRGEGNPYCQTKIESERCILSFNDPGKMGVIVIRPGDVYGEGSVPWVSRPVEMMRKGIFALPGSGQGYMNHVYVDNLIDGILLAVDQRAFGQAFNLTDGRRTTNLDYFTRLSAAAKVSKARLVPSGAFYAVGALGSLLSRVGVEKLDVGIDTVRYLLRPGTYSIEKARSTLGYAPAVGLDEGMNRVSESFR